MADKTLTFLNLEILYLLPRSMFIDNGVFRSSQQGDVSFSLLSFYHQNFLKSESNHGSILSITISIKVNIRRKSGTKQVI